MVVQTTIRMPEELHQKLKAEAEYRGLTLNALLIHVLWKWSRREGGDKAWKTAD